MADSGSFCVESNIEKTSSVLSQSSATMVILFISGLEPSAATVHVSGIAPAGLFVCYQQISCEADMDLCHDHSVYSCFELFMYAHDILAVPCTSSCLLGGCGGAYAPEYPCLDVVRDDASRYDALAVLSNDCEAEDPCLDVGQDDAPRFEALEVLIPNDCVADLHAASESRPPLPEEHVFKQPSRIVQLATSLICLEVSEHVRDLVEHVNLGLNRGHPPELAVEGTGGVYFMKDECGVRNVAVFKPMDEEPMAVNNPRGYTSSHMGGEGLRKGTRAGGGAFREVAAYILDHPSAGRRWETKKDGEEGFAGVPATVLVRCFHEAFTFNCTHSEGHKKAKLGSLQQFVCAFASCEDLGMSYFSVEEVHKITVLDLRLANTDRHAGNILLCRKEDGALKLVPVDHGYCLPEKFGDCTFEWLYWPQASQPYGPAALKYIESLDAEQDIKLLQQSSGWDMQPTCAWVLRIATMVLKKGAAAGLTPFQIGCIMSCSKSLESKPPIEALLEQAEALGCSPSSTDPSFLLDCLATLLDDYVVRVYDTSSM